MTITIPYKPRKPFQSFHENKKRWSVLVCHRAMGKSVAVINHMIRAACLTPKGVFSIIAPTYTQGKRTLWPYLRDYAGVIPNTKFNEAEMLVTFPNQSRLYLLGSENPDALRGIHQHGVALDEYQHQPQDLFGEIIMPTLTTHNGFAVFSGTVKTKGNLWKLWNDKKDDSDWFALFARASESGVLSQAQLQAARTNMTQEQYDQEYELEPLAYLEGAIFGDEMRWLRKNAHIANLRLTDGIQVDTYWDLGVADYTVVWFTQWINGKLYVIDCYATHNKSLHDIAKKLRMMDYDYGTHYLPHDSAQREPITLQTRADFLENALTGKIETIARIVNKQIALDNFRFCFKRFYFNEKMEIALSALEQYQRKFDERNNVFLQEPKHTWESHYVDGMLLASQVIREKLQIESSIPLASSIQAREFDEPHYADDGGFNV